MSVVPQKQKQVGNKRPTEQQLKQLINSQVSLQLNRRMETKVVWTLMTTSPSQGLPVVARLNTLAQGVSQTQRIGDSVRNATVRICLTVNSITSQDCKVRIILFREKATSVLWATNRLSEILQDVGESMLSPYNPDQIDDQVIHQDNMVHLMQYGTPNFLLTRTFPVASKSTFNSTVSTTSSNGLYLLVMSDSP